MNIDESIYERIERLCRENNIKGAELLRRAGISKSTLTELKKGRSKSLSVPVVKKIAGYFDVSVDYLMTGEEKKVEVTEEELKIALFGGDGEVTDEMWQEAINFAKYIKERELKKGDNDK